MGIRCDVFVVAADGDVLVTGEGVDAVTDAAVARVALGKLFVAVQELFTGPLDVLALAMADAEGLAPVWGGEMLPVDHGFGPARFVDGETAQILAARRTRCSR